MSPKNLLPLLLLTLFASATASEVSFQRNPVELPPDTERMLVADLNNDGRQELITVVGEKLRIYFQSSEGFDFGSGYSDITFPGTAVGWDIAPGLGKEPGTSIVALIDGRQVLRWPVNGTQVAEPEIMLAGLAGFLGKGVNRLHFSQDINDDGRMDLVIPAAGQLNLHLGKAAGGFEQSLSVRSNIRQRTNLNSRRLSWRTGQAITIPSLLLKDLNGDGLNDLESRSSEQLDVFIARDEAARYFDAEPSYSLNILEIEERLGDFDIDQLDFSNLTGVLALTHEELLEDIDGDNIADLLLREGGKVSVFGGTVEGMNLEQPRQVLRSGGNVLSTFLYDENEDGLKDLWLWRVESISVGDIFMWLALSGSISIEAFIYHNEGERFARRPARRINVALTFPSVIRMASSYQDLSEQARNTQSDDIVPTSGAQLDDDPNRLDLVALVGNRLDVFFNSITPEPGEEEFLGSLGYNRQRNDYEINLRELIDNVSISNNPQLEAVAGRSPDISITLDAEVRNGDVIPLRLNADEQDDLLVFTSHSEERIEGVILLSR